MGQLLNAQQSLELRDVLTDLAVSILKVDAKDVVVRFPSEAKDAEMDGTVDVDIIIRAADERDAALRKKLAEQIGRAIQYKIDGQVTVVCMVQPFDYDKGYWHS